MKKHFLSKKTWLSMISCLLVCIIFVAAAPQPVFEAIYEPMYISVLCLFYAGDYAAARQKCLDAGFIPTEYDLNKGNEEDVIVLGYRTTEDRAEAITDVRALYMGLGYEEYHYGDILKQQKEQMEQIARQMIICCKEFKANYEKGSPQAQLAYEIFNHIRLDDLPGTPLLGDYLMSDACMPVTTEEDGTTAVLTDPPGVERIAHYLVHGTAAFGNLLYSTMVSAVSDYNPSAEYQVGGYEIEVNVPATQPVFTLPPEMESSIIDSVLSEAGVETTTEETIPNTDDITEITTETAEIATTGDTTAGSAETTEETITTEATAEETETTATQEAAVITTGTTGETTLVPAETPAETTETTPEVTEIETTEKTETTETTETTEETETEETTETEHTEPDPNEIVRLVLNCDKNYSNWAERIHLTGVVDILKNDDFIDLFDTAYQNQALNIRAQVQDFAAKYQNAAARYAVLSDTQWQSDAGEYNTDDPSELCGEVYTDIKASREQDDSKADAAYLAAYKMLDQYPYDENMTVAQYLVDIGTKAYANYKELQELYPLIAAMTDGQVQMVQMNGLLPVIIALTNNGSITDNARGMLDDLDGEMLAETNEPYISVYAGVDPGRDSEMIAITDELKAKQSAGAEFQALTEPSKFDTYTNKVMSRMQLLSQIVGAITGFMTLGGMFTGKIITMGMCWNLALTGGFWGTIGGFLGTLMFSMSMVCGAVIILLAVLKVLVNLIRKWIKGEDIEWSPIPRMVFDYYDKSYVQYHAVYRYSGEDTGRIREYKGMVCDLLSEKGDLNNGSGKRWCSLYYTKTPEIGSPLVIPEEGQPLVVSNESNRIKGYTPLGEFNSVTAADLNSYSKKSKAPNIHLFYKTELNENGYLNGGADADIGNSKYVTGLKLVYSDTESKAKTQLMSAGYTIYPKNLMPMFESGIISDDYNYCYIGYQTSSSPQNAITDIRIMPRETLPVRFGTGGYTAAGSTKLGDSIYYTCDPNMGEPVTDNFMVINDPKDAKPGWEPVLTFGGFEYDFNNANIDYDINSFSETSTRFDKIKKKDPTAQDYLDAVQSGIGINDGRRANTFLYYLPSKIYTADTEDGPAAEYLGGLAIFESSHYDVNENDYRYEAFCAYYASLRHGGRVHYFNPVGGYTTGMVITRTTYNPKRAIYGIKSYTAAPKCTALQSSLGKQAEGAYAACDVITDRYYSILTETDKHAFSYSPDHTFYVMEPDEKERKSAELDGKLKIVPEDYEKAGYWDGPYSVTESYANWGSYQFKRDEFSKMRKKALYLQGANGTSLPLTENDVIFTRTPLEQLGDTGYSINGTPVSTGGFYSVQDFKNPNATAPHDISLQLGSSMPRGRYAGAFYIYLRRTPVEKCYISEIHVASYELYSYAKSIKIPESSLSGDVCDQLNSNGDDICIMTLLSNCSDEIFPFDISTLNATEFHENTGIGESIGDWFENVGYAIGGWFSGFVSESTENSLQRKRKANNIKDNVRCWQDDLDKYLSNECSYIGFSRTDNEVDAIKGVIKYAPKDGYAPSVLNVDGVQYSKCGDAVHDYLEGDYYIYATKQTGANPGRPISALSINTQPIVRGAATARTATAPNTSSKADPGCMNFIHLFYDDEGMYMDAIYMGRGTTSRYALCDLLDMNCCDVILYDVHSTAENDFVYIGYTKYQPLTNPDRNAKAYAVRDIRIVTETDPDLTVQINGVTYTRAYDKFSYFMDNSDAVALNDADRAYLYFTTKGSEAPIDKIGIAERDRVPPLENSIQVWENILTEQSIRYNINNSFITFTASDTDIVADNRLYLFAKRIDNSVKFGSEIVGGHCDEITQYGNLNYVKG